MGDCDGDDVEFYIIAELRLAVIFNVIKIHPSKSTYVTELKMQRFKYSWLGQHLTSVHMLVPWDDVSFSPPQISLFQTTRAPFLGFF